MPPHALFPLGMWCCHHYRWHRLEEAVAHRKIDHADCEGCQLEADLGRSMLDEARSAVAQVEASWQT